MNQPPKLFFFDVGHGSCAFLQDGTVTTVIDCKNSALFVEFLISQKIQTISQVIISHADADHIAGVLALIQSDYVRIGTVFVNPDASKDSVTWRDLRHALQDACERGKLSVRTEIGDNMSSELKQGEVRIEVLAPGIAARLAGPGGLTPQQATATSNTMSVVLRLHHKDHPVVLMPGDLDAAGLADLIQRGRGLQCDILVFPHHGGHIAHSSNPTVRERENHAFASTLIDQALPQLVLFSIGRGLFSTPRPEIVLAIRRRVPACHIHCTQLSEQCQRSAPPSPVFNFRDSPVLGRRTDKTCGGSLEITFDGNRTVRTIDRRSHEDFISGSVSTPLCR